MTSKARLNIGPAVATGTCMLCGRKPVILHSKGNGPLLCGRCAHGKAMVEHDQKNLGQAPEFIPDRQA